MTGSLLEEKRREYRPVVPNILRHLDQVLFQESKDKKKPLQNLRAHFPKTLDQSPFNLQKGTPPKPRALKVGLLFSGGEASGGHNVIAGLFDGLEKIDPHSHLIGFLGGIDGVLKNRFKPLLEEEIAPFRNQGGFDLIGTGRGKIETPEDLETALKNCQALNLDGLVIVGGDDSNTNGAILAEYFLEKKSPIRIIGIPKTIDGDLRSEEIEISFGFDTACKTYSEMIGNLARDAISSKKYYHFIKLMGRSASHICMECALAVHPNYVLIGEERKHLSQIIREIADLICLRAAKKKEYGVILIPEGLIEFIPEMEQLILELQKTKIEELKEPHKTFFLTLPEKIQKQLNIGRDPHGNLNVSQIDTQQLLIDLVSQELKKRSDYKGSFSPLSHFFGYEGRSAYPSNFDANYSYALGLTASLAIRDSLTGVICSLQKLAHPTEVWTVKAVPAVQLIHFELRKGEKKPVIEKYLIDTHDPSFIKFSSKRDEWGIEDDYQYPGPIQFFGPSSLIDSVPITLQDHV